MTDRELLEAAAKAAGIDAWWTENYGGVFLIQHHSPRIWNPLTDDGDALRLAVKLGMSVVLYRDPDETWCSVGINDGWREGHCEGDPYAATRRAIVRAAAALEKP